MKRRNDWWLPVSMIVGVPTIIALVLGGPAFAQNGASEPLGLPQDWSHRHLIYSNPETAGEAASRGTLGEWNRKADDPRFLLQLEKKLETAKEAAKATVGDDGAAVADSGVGVWALSGKSKPSKPKGKPSPSPSGPEIHRDWSSVMGGASGVGKAGTYPAKFGFAVNAKSCADDFVVFTTSSAGATSTGSFYQATGVFTGLPVAGQTTSITNMLFAPDQVLTLTADASVNTGLKFAVGANPQAAATNLADAIARNGGTVGMTATASGTAVTLNSITANVKKVDITPAESLSNFDWVEQNDGSATAGQPTIFALNQLYADTVANGGCQTSDPDQAVPAVYWSYNTGDGAIADLSPVLSFYDNGRQVVFVQRSGGVASLVLLKWSSAEPVGTLGEPTAPTSVTQANYRSCTAPCMTVMTFNSSPNDTTSAPFVDYSNDTLYVGDASGKLHKFTGVFSGTPGEVVSAGANVWPAAVSTTALTSPVYDPATGKVFVGSTRTGSAAGTGALHAVDATIGSGSGGITSTGQLFVNNETSPFDTPIVDSSAGTVYVFVGDDSANSGHGAVYQFLTGTSLASQPSPNRAVTGTGKASTTLWSGAFDDAYFSGSGGNLYVCGGTAGNANPIPVRISLSGTFGATVTAISNDLAGGDKQCSPVSYVSNSTGQYIFMGVSDGNDPACVDSGGGLPPGCVYMLKLLPIFDATSLPSTMADTIQFMSVSTSTGLSTSEGAVATALTTPQAGKYAGGLTITQGAASPGGTAFRYTLRKNGANTNITCDIGAGKSTCSDTKVGDTATYAAGDTMDVQVERTSGSGTLTTTFRVTLDAWPQSTATAGLNAPDGTGGIIIDNTLSGGGSQVYYSTLRSPGIAVQASQAGLQ